MTDSPSKHRTVKPSPATDVHMNSVILTVTRGLWKTEPSCPPTGGGTESCTPQLLSSSNSLTCTLSPKPKRQRNKKKLFKKHLTLRDLGVDEVAVTNSDRGYTLVYPNVKKRRIASQDVLTLNLMTSYATTSTADSKLRASHPLNLDLTNIHPTRNKSAVHFTSTTEASLSQLKKALKSKLAKARENRPSKRQRILKSRCAPEPNVEEGQSVECVEMNTGSLYVYKGGGLPRKTVFIRRL